MDGSFIPLSVPNLAGRELEYVTSAIKDGWVSTAGSFVGRFEKEIASYLGVSSAVACQSGTAGIHVALRLCGVRPGDMVVVPALTFIAAVNPVRYLGGEPVFIGCDESLCMDPRALASFCQKECDFDGSALVHHATGKRIRAIVVVHVFGNMADMPAILEISKRYNLKVVEDATEALGTRYTKGVFAGRYAGTMGDFGVYSFNGTKIITTGGGGMLVAQNESELEHARHLTTQAKSDPAYFEHDEVGYNYRMTNTQAAMGVAQLEQIESFIEVKKRNYDEYVRLAAEIEGIEFLPFREGTRSNRWFYAMLCEGSSEMRDHVIRGLADNGIQARPVWGIICDQVPYRGSVEFDADRARWSRERIVNVPCSTDLSLHEVRRVMATVQELVAQ